GLNRVDIFQDDNKSCGPHSVYRILKYGYGESITYQFLKDKIGTTDFPYDIPILGVHITGTLLKDSDIGQPPTTLARILREIGYSSASDQGDASDERIKNLLWAGIPVTLLLQVDDIVGDNGGTKVSAPALHYWVANGY